jgi:hypothetical protein
MPPAKSSLNLNHEILILDALLEKELDESKMNEITRTLVEDLIQALGMKPLGPLEIYPAADLDYPGWSFIQPITTSHISGHYFIDTDGKNPNIHIDIYSCKKFKWQKVVETAHQHLIFGKWYLTFIERKFSQDRKMLDHSGTGSNFDRFID